MQNHPIQMDTNAIRIEDDIIGGRYKHLIYWHTSPTYEANYLGSINPVIQPKIGKILKCHLNSCWSGMYSMQLVIALQVHRFQWRVCILHPPNTRTGLVRPVDIQANQFHNEAWAGYRVKMKSNQSPRYLIVCHTCVSFTQLSWSSNLEKIRPAQVGLLEGWTCPQNLSPANRTTTNSPPSKQILSHKSHLRLPAWLQWVHWGGWAWSPRGGWSSSPAASPAWPGAEPWRKAISEGLPLLWGGMRDSLPRNMNGLKWMGQKVRLKLGYR